MALCALYPCWFVSWLVCWFHILFDISSLFWCFGLVLNHILNHFLGIVHLIHVDTMSKQPTLGCFKGFTRTVVHRGQQIQAEIPAEIHVDVEKKERCPQCDKTFVNKAGLSVHLKCVHSHDHVRADDAKPSSFSIVAPLLDSVIDAVLEIMQNRAERQGAMTNVEVDTCNNDGTTVPTQTRLKRKGQDHRYQHSIEKKARVIEAYESGLKQDEVNLMSRLHVTLCICP